MRIVRAPFAAEQVASLNGYQADGTFHEFTCGNDGCPEVQAVLVAHADGWHCPACGYTQDWAHEFMADGSWCRSGSARIWISRTSPQPETRDGRT
jgi:ribosomal protein S27AE